MFKNAKRGNKVIDYRVGEGEIVDVEDSIGSDYPIKVDFPSSVMSYTFDGKLYTSDLHPSLFPAGTEIPRPEVKVKNEIRPKEAGELWRNKSDNVTVYRKGKLCFHDLNKRESCGYVDFKRDDDSGWVCQHEPVHGQDGWTRIYPPVEDENIERIEIENVTWGHLASGHVYPKIDKIYDLSLPRKRPMKIILEIPKEK